MSAVAPPAGEDAAAARALAGEEATFGQGRAPAPAPARPGSPAVPRVLARPHRRRVLALLVANGFGQAASALVLGLVVQSGFERFVSGPGAGRPGAGSVVALGGILLAAALMSGWLRRRERTDAERLGQNYVHHLRLVLYRHLAALSPRTVQRRAQGAVALRFVGDLNAVRQWVALGLSRLVVAGSCVSAATVGLAVINLTLALAVGLVLAAGAAGVLLLGRPLRTAARRARRRRVRLSANITEQVGALGVVQAFGATDRERGRMRQQSRSLARAMVDRARTVGTMRGVAEATAVLAPGAVLMAGAIEVAAGRTDPATVVAAMTVVGLLAPMLRDLGRVPEYWHVSRVSMEHIESFLATRAMAVPGRDAPDLEPREGRLAFDGVVLEGALRGVDAVAPPGCVVAVTGLNGSGKSTLLGLAARLIEPDAGRVMLDGQDLAGVTQASLRRAVSLVLPDLPLLRGDVEHNLRYRDPDVDDAELERVRALTGLDEVLAQLPDGAATKVVEGGRNLSAGQRARLALARALVGDPPVLLLDEVEANLDVDAVDAVRRVLEDRRGRRTTIVVTHRPELVAQADHVWRLEDGRLGPPAAGVWRLQGDRLVNS
jgi:ABC-type multidrug transport system fused ATPase/permease subunit